MMNTLEYIVTILVFVVIVIVSVLRLASIFRRERMIDVKDALRLAIKCEHVEGVLCLVREQKHLLSHEDRDEAVRWLKMRNITDVG
jgi:hypothetical protein